jgi:hypothetical protein
MPKGEIEQSTAKQARKASPINDNKPRRVVAGEAQFRDGKSAAGTTNRNKTSSSKAGARQGNPRSTGKKPSGTNVGKGGGSAAKGSK